MMQRAFSLERLVAAIAATWVYAGCEPLPISHQTLRKQLGDALRVLWIVEDGRARLSHQLVPGMPPDDAANDCAACGNLVAHSAGQVGTPEMGADQQQPGVTTLLVVRLRGGQV